MKLFNILLLSLSALLLSCSSDDEPVSDNCTQLQQELNDATSVMLDAFGAYVQDTSNSTLCDAYATALMDRIENAQAMLDADCLPPATTMTTQQAIMEDQESLNELDC